MASDSQVPHETLPLPSMISTVSRFDDVDFLDDELLAVLGEEEHNGKKIEDLKKDSPLAFSPIFQRHMAHTTLQFFNHSYPCSSFGKGDRCISFWGH